MRVELSDLPFLPYGFLSKTITTAVTITTTTTTTTTTNCEAVFEKSYCLSEDARNSKLPRRRTAFTDEQLSQLENAFQKCQYPKIDVRMKLASETQLPETRIQIWFKNRRAKHRKKLRNIADPEITSNTITPKFNAIITWRPNDTLIFVTSAREAVTCKNHFPNMIANCLQQRLSYN